MMGKYMGIANPLMSLFQTKQMLKSWVRFARSHSNIRGKSNAMEVSYEIEEEILISSDEEEGSSISSFS
jgi:hypothetical protein